jgi:hypothetical protein
MKDRVAIEGLVAAAVDAGNALGAPRKRWATPHVIVSTVRVRDTETKNQHVLEQPGNTTESILS